jgi:TRAP-type C4-dicarboxylate transport system permease small subunit
MAQVTAPPPSPSYRTGALERLSRLIAAIGLAALVLLAVITIIDIVGREFFFRPIDGFSDIADLVIVFAAASCFPISLIEQDHVAVRALGRLHWRLREYLELFGHGVLLVVFTLIVWQLGVYTLDVFTAGQTTWLIHIPVWPLWTATTLVLAICLPVQVLVIAHQVRRCLSPVPLRSQHAETPGEEGIAEEVHGGG